MMILKTAYVKGAAQKFREAGIQEDMAEKLAESIIALEKKSAFFSQDDDDDSPGYFRNPDGSISWSRILIPLGLALGAGTLGYRSGINGFKNRSFLDNMKNYVAGTFRRLTRSPLHNYMVDRNAARDVEVNAHKTPL